MSNMFKASAIIVFLFILFLWSGGIYEYSNHSAFFRHNKISGKLEQYRWKDNIEGWMEPSKR